MHLNALVLRELVLTRVARKCNIVGFIEANFVKTR